jgi:membrane-bound lytic murein transglycosylase A
MAPEIIGQNLGYNPAMAKHLTVFFLYALLLGGCATRSPGIGDPIDWSKLQSWDADNHSEVWSGFLRGCQKLKEQQWREVCLLAENSVALNDTQAREFFESHFEVRPVYAQGGLTEGLITGYYEPLLQGSWEKTEEFRYPLYGVPEDLLTVDLGDQYPQLKDMRLRGKLEGNKIVPYYDRAQLDENQKLLQGSELLWVNNLVDVFFLHVQGSGQIQLDDGSRVAVGYAAQNGHPYRSIGRVLIEMGELEKEKVTLFTIRDWLEANPERLNEVLAKNPSYVFFELRDAGAAGPVGSLNVMLTPTRSIAVDRNVIPLGAPVWLQTTLPDEQASPFNQLMLAQDTGGAIKGNVRADVFWGRGDVAEKMAGLMKQKGKIYVLLPKGYPLKKHVNLEVE